MMTRMLGGKTGVRPENMIWIFAEDRRESWLDSIRILVLKEATGRFPEAFRPGNYLVIKEPNGSMGAPLLMEALPESRMILLLRDPRDVAASTLDAAREGGWLHSWVDENKIGWRKDSLADSDPDTFIEMNARVYLQQISAAKEAYEAHPGPKALVRYEELVADTLGTMRRIYRELGLGEDRERLERAVGKHSWEMIPEEKKGEGKFYRKGEVGSWREDHPPEQVRTIERITAPILAQFYAEY